MNHELVIKWLDACDWLAGDVADCGVGRDEVPAIEFIQEGLQPDFDLICKELRETIAGRTGRCYVYGADSVLYVVFRDDATGRYMAQNSEGSYVWVL